MSADFRSSRRPIFTEHTKKVRCAQYKSIFRIWMLLFRFGKQNAVKEKYRRYLRSQSFQHASNCELLYNFPPFVESDPSRCERKRNHTYASSTNRYMYTESVRKSQRLSHLTTCRLQSTLQTSPIIASHISSQKQSINVDMGYLYTSAAYFYTHRSLSYGFSLWRTTISWVWTTLLSHYIKC